MQDALLPPGCEWLHDRSTSPEVNGEGVGGCVYLTMCRWMGVQSNFYWEFGDLALADLLQTDEYYTTQNCSGCHRRLTPIQGTHAYKVRHA